VGHEVMATIETTARKARRQRERVHDMLKDDAPQSVIQVRNGTAIADAWHDPDDLRVNQRLALIRPFPSL
jgi:hypothetical protein